MASGNSQRNLASPEVRRETFKSYPKKYPSVTQLVDAGFYYVDSGDECQCYLCDVRLFNWERDDDPMSEHLKYRPSCEIFNLTKTADQSVPPPPVYDLPRHSSDPVHASKLYTPQPGTVIHDPSRLPNNYKTEHTQVNSDYSSSSMHSPPIASHVNPLLHCSPPLPNDKMENQPPPPLPSYVPHQYPPRTHPSSMVYHPQTCPQLYPTYFNHYLPTPTTTFIPPNHASSPPFAACPRSISVPYIAPTHVDPRFTYTHRV